MMLNYIKLNDVLPRLTFDSLVDVIDKYKINTRLRLAHFLSQCAHESSNFKVTTENLNYSSDALLRVFPKYFNRNNVNNYARNPVKIASRVYANRMSNGDEASQDGWIYRGRGYIQLTGKDNYAAFDKTCNDNVLDNPDLVANKYPLVSAGWFWDTLSLNSLADKGNTTADVTAITRKVNGGENGLDDRILLFNKFYSLLDE